MAALIAVNAASAFPVVPAVVDGAVMVCAPDAVNTPPVVSVEAVKLFALWNEMPVPAAFLTAYTPIAAVFALILEIAESTVSAAVRATVAVPEPLWNVRFSALAVKEVAPSVEFTPVFVALEVVVAIASAAVVVVDTVNGVEPPNCNWPLLPTDAVIPYVLSELFNELRTCCSVSAPDPPTLTLTVWAPPPFAEKRLKLKFCAALARNVAPGASRRTLLPPNRVPPAPTLVVDSPSPVASTWFEGPLKSMLI